MKKKILLIWCLTIFFFANCSEHKGYSIFGNATIMVTNENGEFLKKEDAINFAVFAMNINHNKDVLKPVDSSILTYYIPIEEHGIWKHNIHKHPKEETQIVLENAIKRHGIQIIDKKGKYKTKIYNLENAKYTIIDGNYIFTLTVQLEKK